MPRKPPPEAGADRNGSGPDTPEDWSEIAVHILDDTVEDFVGGRWRDASEDRLEDSRLSRALAHAGLSTEWRR